MRRRSGALAGLGVLMVGPGGAWALEPDTLFPRGLAPLDLGATATADHAAGACAECHAAVSSEWAHSRHAVAWTNGIFQREYQRQPLDWCVHCHAPLADTGVQGPPVVSAAATEGVSCAVCHLRDGQILSAARRDGSPHDTRVVPGFGGADYCAGCHQFNFPVVEEDGRVVRYTDHPMQKTVAEFRAGPYADQPGECLGCHGLTPAGHRYPGGHAPEALDDAVALDVCRADRSTLRMVLSNVGAGHAIPTGDLHRHFQLRAWRETDPARLYEAFIGRAFAPAEDDGKIVRLDTSILPRESRAFEVGFVALGGDAAAPFAVELRYIYTPDEEPTARNSPGEPTYVVVEYHRYTPEEVAPCTED